MNAFLLHKQNTDNSAEILRRILQQPHFTVMLHRSDKTDLITGMYLHPVTHDNTRTAYHPEMFHLLPPQSNGNAIADILIKHRIKPLILQQMFTKSTDLMHHLHRRTVMRQTFIIHHAMKVQIIKHKE